ncbi:glutamate racemase [Flavimarina sp. Hel_I_48]|uniref:glutamate racemase n=1 Tax=Flavimarina sp. Hel_I_48 TaxID=1392488 RepID=UPI0004DEE2EA|nr:glutamate racemase [Flavimarina sp. Hel_I_48]
MANNNPIGFFDSGVGGTSIWRESVALLPAESTIYLADSANAPYGEKSTSEIIQLSLKNTQKLIDFGCKMIVVPCNTATTNAISYLRENFDLPFIGIEPALKPAALSSKNKAIGILATKGTLSSALFAKTSSIYAGSINVIEVVGTGLVELIEAGKADSVQTRELLKLYLQPMLEANIDFLVLGCSHYPYLIEVLRSLLPSAVTIIDSGVAVARQIKAVLEKEGLFTATNSARHKLYSNANTAVLHKLTENIQVKKEVSFLDF